MTKQTLLVTALLGAMSSAMAADVQLYGVLDYGLNWQKKSLENGTDSSVLSMKSGQYIGSRWGMKGSEELSNGMKVGFVLEGGLSADTGALGNSGRLFGREARVYVDGDYGLLSLGRMGSIVGGNGPYARFGHVANAFSCGWGDIGGSLQVVSLGYDFMDNVIAYNTPKFGGFDMAFQTSLGTNSLNYGDGVEGKSSVERMYSAAVRYQGQSLMVAAGIESINHAQPAAREAGLDDSFSWNLGANYTIGGVKLYGYGQLFKNYENVAKTTMFGAASGVTGGVDGYGINVGFETKAIGGTVKGTFGVGDFESSLNSDVAMTTWQTALGYTYPLSRRTTFYTAGAWIHNSNSSAYERIKPTAVENVYEFTFGLVHKF